MGSQAIALEGLWDNNQIQVGLVESTASFGLKIPMEKYLPSKYIVRFPTTVKRNSLWLFLMCYSFKEHMEKVKSLENHPKLM